MTRSGMLKQTISGVLLGLFLSGPVTAAPNGPLVILHMNVGQGDATLIIIPSGETILIDGGDKSTGRKIVTSRLRTLGYDRIDYVIATHFDADHIGGLDDAGRLMTHRPRKVHDRGEGGPLPIKTTQAYRSYKAVYDGDRTGPVVLGPGLFQFKSDVRILIASGNGCVFGQGYVADRKLDENASSLSLVLNYGNFDYFIGGDLTGGGLSGGRRTADIETRAAQVVGKVDVLRLNHHGSETSSNEAFLAALDPQVVVVSVGNGGSNRSRYRHPRRSVLNRLHDLASAGALERIYLTNQGETDGGPRPEDGELLDVVNGDIAIVSNGSWFLVNGVAWPTDGVTSGAVRLEDRETEVCVPTGKS